MVIYKNNTSYNYEVKNGVTYNTWQIPHDYSKDYFTIEDVSGATNTITITKQSSSAPSIEVFYSLDETNWASMGTTSTTAITATIPANGKIYLKANTNAWASSSGYPNVIKSSGNCNISGNIMSLLKGDNFYNTAFDNNNVSAFTQLFLSCTNLIKANNLVLPSNVTDSCYSGLFSGCSSLTTGPKLPATTLYRACYSGLFSGCSSLTTAPSLPALTLANKCYQNLFSGCINLVTAPTLPATTLALYSYDHMFYNCKSLTTAPILQAKTLVDGCYRQLFEGCTNLNTVTTYADDISASGCLTYWLNDVSATGEFYALGSAQFPSGASGIPSGWTVHNSL